MNKPTIDTPNNINKLKKQIQALEYQIKHDTREKDIIIHKQAMKDLKEKLKQYKTKEDNNV